MYKLPTLKYDYDSLEPIISRDIMTEHHKGHHQTYVDNINFHISDLEDKNKFSLLYLLTSAINSTALTVVKKDAIKNNAGGHYNHSFFWYTLTGNKNDNDLNEVLNEKITHDFGTFEKFQIEFNQKALGIFGSGWVWLVYDTSNKKLKIITTANQDNPISSNANHIPILTLDVWEHAYYLQYKRKRIDYINNWWKIINWTNVKIFYEKFALTGIQLAVACDGIIDLNMD